MLLQDATGYCHCACCGSIAVSIEPQPLWWDWPMDEWHGCTRCACWSCATSNPGALDTESRKIVERYVFGKRGGR
jgi:hypothetical protein